MQKTQRRQSNKKYTHERNVCIIDHEIIEVVYSASGTWKCWVPQKRVKDIKSSLS